MNPEDFDIDPTFTHWQGDPAEDHIGPFFYKPEGHRVTTAFRLRPHHCNAFGTVHGGLLMAFADYTLCGAALTTSQDPCVTVSCNNEFVSGASDGELLTGIGEVIRRTGSMVFTRALIQVDDRVVLASSGVIKMIKARQ